MGKLGSSSYISILSWGLKKKTKSQWISVCSGGVGHLNEFVEDDDTSAAVVFVNSAHKSWKNCSVSPSVVVSDKWLLLLLLLFSFKN